MATTDVLSLSEARSALGLSGLAADNDTLIQAWVTAVSARIDQMVGGAVVARTYTGETYDGGNYSIRLRTIPIYSVSSVVEYNGAGTATTLTAETVSSKPTAGYVIDGETGWIHRRASGADFPFAAGRRNVVVTYQAGLYASTSAVSEQVKRAAQILLQHLWGRQHGAGSPFGNPEPTVFVGFGIPNAVVDLLGTLYRAQIGIA